MEAISRTNPDRTRAGQAATCFQLTHGYVLETGFEAAIRRPKIFTFSSAALKAIQVRCSSAVLDGRGNCTKCKIDKVLSVDDRALIGNDSGLAVSSNCHRSPSRTCAVHKLARAEDIRDMVTSHL